MSKTWGPCGKLQRWVIAPRDVFSCCAETWCSCKRNTLSVSLWFPVCLRVPWESVILSKLCLPPRNDLYTNTMVCFSYKHQWLIVPFTRGIGVLWLQRLEWMSNFKGCLEWSGGGGGDGGGGDLMVRLGLCLGTGEAVLAFASMLQTDGTNQITALALSVCYDREQQLNRHNILTGINMWMCNWYNDCTTQVSAAVLLKCSLNTIALTLPIDFKHVVSVSLNTTDDWVRKNKQIRSGDSDAQNICCCYNDPYRRLLCVCEEKSNKYFPFPSQSRLFWVFPGRLGTGCGSVEPRFTQKRKCTRRENPHLIRTKSKSQSRIWPKSALTYSS